MDDELERGRAACARRVWEEAHESLASFRRKLDGAYDWTAWKEDLGLLRRRLAGAQGT